MPSVGRLRYLEALPHGRAVPQTRSTPTLVLIHAFPLNARMWEPQLALADLGWRVVAPQLRGMDESSLEGGPAGNSAAVTSIDDYAGDVIDLLDALHIEDAVIGGLSIGGYVTLAIFRHAPRYFRGMVLADTRPQADTPAGVEGRKRMLEILRRAGPQGVLEEMLPGLLGETTRRQRPDIADRLRELVSANPATAVAGAIAALMTRPDSTPLLATIHCPTLIVVGEEDTLTTPQLSRDMHQAIATSELVTLPDAGHLSSLEQPDAFNAALERFLTRHV
jgi:pimeloyl-ACP methyl ester carboxylesterase